MTLKAHTHTHTHFPSLPQEDATSNHLTWQHAHFMPVLPPPPGSVTKDARHAVPTFYTCLSLLRLEPIGIDDTRKFPTCNASLTLKALTRTHTHTHTHTHTLSEPSPRSLRLLRLERHHVDATAAIVRWTTIDLNCQLNQPSNTTSKVMLSNGLPGVFAKTNVL